MRNSRYKVFCADCQIQYEQDGMVHPSCCEACSSTWIAVKTITKQPRRCCPEPEIRGGKCVNCGEWAEDLCLVTR